MPQEGKISLLGLSNWTDDLFSQMHWPDPFLPTTVDNEEVDPVLSQDAFLDELYAQTAELEVIYPNPEFMKRMIGSWSLTRLPVWNELWATTQYEYNPIENYNRYEEGTDTDTHSGADTETHAGTDTYRDSLARTGTDTVTDTPDSTTSTGAYNASTSDPALGLTPTSHIEGENVTETVYGSTDTRTGSNTLGHTVSTGYNSELEKEHDLHIHGNIGVMSTQQMIREQREIVSFNFYDKMIRDFMERFLVLVY